MTPSYIAIDWGTTNRRAFLMSTQGQVIDSVRDDRGVLAVDRAAYPADLAALRVRLGHYPAIAAGMVGSTVGWQEVPYLAAPVDIAGLAAGLVAVEGADVTIVPGVAIDKPAGSDVMRGEEVQILGAVAAGHAPADALFCQPGTHNKWVWTQAGRIVDFATAMTGEMFALLRDHSILKAMLAGPVADGPAFRRGVHRAASANDLLSALFGVRAGVLRGTLDAGDSAAFASGLLIGADVASRDVAHAGPVHLLADPGLGALYATAIEELGGRSTLLDSHAAFTAGIHHIRELAS